MGDLGQIVAEEIERTERSIRELDNPGVAKASVPSSESRVSLDRYSIKEVSVITGMSESTIRRYVRDGILKAWQPAEKGGRIMIPASELTKYSNR